MKIISEKCRINSRAFYELFKNQKEAFKVAGVPYSDEKRKSRTGKCCQKKDPPTIQVLSKKTIFVVDKNRLDEYRSRNISDPFNEIRYKFTINKNIMLCGISR
jgi:hypothetical protein